MADGTSEEQMQLEFMEEILGTSTSTEETPDEQDPGNDGSKDSKDQMLLEGEQTEETTQEVDAQSANVQTDVVDSKVESSTGNQSVEDMLRQQILELTAQLQQGQQRYPEAPKPVEKVEGSEGVQQVPAAKQSEATPYLSADELDQIIDKPELILTAIQRAQADVLSQARSEVASEVQRQIMITKAVAEFYDANQDLSPFSSFVKMVMAEKEKTMQDKTYAEIFKSTADDCRKRLGLPDPTVQVKTRQTNNGSKPAFAGSRQNVGKPAQQKLFDEHAADMLR